MAEAGPSVTLAATCEALAFALGALAPVPAVRSFALTAGVAITLDYLLQVLLPQQGCLLSSS